jgi:glycosyltransferase involved in cell wall biosynthesis
VFYLQDLFPEVGLATGKLKPGPLTALLHRATQLGLRRADRVVVLGKDMRRRVLARGIDGGKVVVIPNWIDTRLVRPAEGNLRRAWELNGEFAVMYSGNLGLSQGLEHVLEAARRMRGEPVVFLFVGEGAAKGRLMAQASEWKLPNVRFLPYQPREQLSASLGTADMHLVPLQRGLSGCIVPSKLYGILAAARPYVAAVEENSEVACVTRANGTGLLIEPDDPGRLVAALRWARANRGELAEMGRRGRRLAEAEYDRRRAVASFEAVLRQAAPARAGRRSAP